MKFFTRRQSDARLELREFFTELSDDQLLQKVSANQLTQEALSLAVSEIARRGLTDPRQTNCPTEQSTELVVLERGLSLNEAHLLGVSLQSARIPYIVSDIRRAHESYVRLVVLSVSLLVPEPLLEDAQEVVAAFRRGDLSIDEHFDPSAET